MRKFIFGVIAVLFCFFLIGADWNQHHLNECCFDELQEELGYRGRMIEALQDSIERLSDSLKMCQYKLTWVKIGHSIDVDSLMNEPWSNLEDNMR